MNVQDECKRLVAIVRRYAIELIEQPCVFRRRIGRAFGARIESNLLRLLRSRTAMIIACGSIVVIVIVVGFVRKIIAITFFWQFVKLKKLKKKCKEITFAIRHVRVRCVLLTLVAAVVQIFLSFVSCSHAEL